MVKLSASRTKHVYITDICAKYCKIDQIVLRGWSDINFCFSDRTRVGSDMDHRIPALSKHAGTRFMPLR